MDRIAIRAALPADAAALQDIRRSVAENRLSDPGSVDEAAYLPFIAKGCCWVAQSGGSICGFAALDAEAASVWALFVAPGAEGRGIGRALLRHMLERARERGLRRLSLSTEPGTRAARFYAAAGWREAGVTEAGEIRFEIGLPAA